MLIKDILYINTDRDFYENFVDGYDLTFKLEFKHKISKKEIIIEDTITLPNLVNRYFEMSIDTSDFETGFYTYKIYLEDLSGTFKLYELGLGLKEFIESSIFENTTKDNDNVFVYEA